MMAGKFIDSMCAIRSNKSEPAKVIPGWNDGSTAWRSAVYNYTPQSPSDPFYTHVNPSAASSSTDTRFRRSSRVSSSAPSAPPPFENEELIAKFNDMFTMRCEARMAQSQSHSRSSTASSQPIKREGSILQPGAEGKLLVPDVKLKVRTGSNTSNSSANATPMSPTSSRKVPGVLFPAPATQIAERRLEPPLLWSGLPLKVSQLPCQYFMCHWQSHFLQHGHGLTTT